MAWLKFDVATPEKPEVLAITIAMGWDDPDLTVGKLLKVWRWFDQHTIEGNAPSVTPALLDRLIGVTGLTQAIANAGWLIVTEGGLQLPNFETHNGKTAKDRALTASRVAKSKSNGKGNAPSVTSALPREEKRREEKNIKEVPTVLTVTPSAQRLPACPNQEIIDLFHSHLPTLPRVEVLNDGRKRTIAARWREVCSDPDIAKSEDVGQAALDWFAWYFGYASTSPFLTGRAKDWRADVDFLMTQSKFAKVVEGHYHKEKAA